MRKKIGKFDVGDYVVCIDNSDRKMYLTAGKIYKIYECYYNKDHDEHYCKIKNDEFLIVSLFRYRFRKATKKDIDNNLVDIVHRKFKDEI